jgi:hypothetical protein
VIRSSRILAALLVGLFAAAGATRSAAAPRVTGIAAVSRNGQTFITWNDASPADPTARYALYQSAQPITEQTIGAAHLLQWDILPDSASIFGPNVVTRVPRAVLAPDQPPLPDGTGLAVVTIPAARQSYYAILPADPSGHPLSEPVPGQSATVQPLSETPAPIQAIEAAREPHPPKSDTAPQPLVLWLHGHGGRESERGNAYLYMGTPDMGYRDGIPGVFTVQQRDDAADGHWLEIRPRDLIRNPDGGRPITTNWFGYEAVPQWSPNRTPFAYPFTEQRLLWIISWVRGHYPIDPERIYCFGESMGGWGAMTFALRHPEIFSAIYPMMPRMRQTALANAVRTQSTTQHRRIAGALLPDGHTRFLDRMDMVKFVTGYAGELPFIGWSIGRHDGFATWREQVDMVHALEATHRGFAFAWNDGGHGTGTRPMQEILRYYPMSRFRLDRSYPAFSHSSLDSNPGNGDVQDGDKEGGINLGFAWSGVIDQSDRWEISISNALNHSDMTVDITPRRTQRFRLSPGETVHWTSSDGASGSTTADDYGLATIPRVVIQPQLPTKVILTR